MKVSLKDGEHNYEPTDFPNGWKWAAGDYYKYPLKLGGASYFVKRFEKKNPENIPGWQLLKSLRRAKQSNLPRIYDIVNNREKNKDVYYVFFDLIEGSTLEEATAAGEQINLQQLTDDLLSAFKSINEQKFWFPDFCEKNIFKKENGRYYLIDLDSAYSSTVLPDNNIDCNQTYWALVFDFYNLILPGEPLEISGINGITFNHLQLIFLILRLRLFRPGTNNRYADLFSSLSAKLKEISPQFGDLFKSMLNNQEPLSPDDIEHIKNLIEEKIINQQEDTQPTEQRKQSVIKYFSISDYHKKEVENYFLKSGQQFTLSWYVDNTKCKLTLLRNNQIFKQLSNKKKSIEISETYNDQKAKIIYTLQAECDGVIEQSESIIVVVDKEIRKIPEVPLIEKDKPKSETKLGLPLKKQAPVIHDFSATKYNIRTREKFTLNWKTENGSSLTLYRNDKLYKNLNSHDSAVTITENDAPGTSILYKLVVENAERESVQKTIQVTLKQPVNNKKTLYIAAVAFILLVLAFVIWKKISTSTTEVIGDPQIAINKTDTIVTPVISLDSLGLNSIIAGDTLTISGKNLLLAQNNAYILFNTDTGKLISVTDGVLQVKIPAKKYETPVNINAFLNTELFTIARNVSIKPRKIIKPNANITKTPAITKQPASSTNRITLNNPDNKIKFYYSVQGQKLYVWVKANNLDKPLQSVQVIVTCDSVGGSNGTSEVKSETLIFGTVENDDSKFKAVSDNFYAVYNRNRTVKKIQLQLSYQ